MKGQASKPAQNTNPLTFDFWVRVNPLGTDGGDLWDGWNDANGDDVYCDDPDGFGHDWYCMVHINEHNVDGSTSYCTHHWRMHDLTDKWGVDENV